ncbi:MAG: response regulator, partial [Verrucomicrobiota bacterium]|nr:response regulator [Verrucomicrobiota bacterium]
MSHLMNGHEADRRKMKILVVDDEPLNVALLSEMLAEAGYTRVQTISDSRVALAACTDFAPDIVLLDWMMPHVSGREILEALRPAAGDLFLPVVVLTADSNDETKRVALQVGASDFLLKPLDHLEVPLRIANLLETRRVHLQLDLQCAAYEEALRACSL